VLSFKLICIDLTNAAGVFMSKLEDQRINMKMLIIVPMATRIIK
jgi:hypothetical protein